MLGKSMFSFIANDDAHELSEILKSPLTQQKRSFTCKIRVKTTGDEAIPNNTKKSVERQRFNLSKNLINNSQFEQMMITLSSAVTSDKFKHCIPFTARRIDAVTNASIPSNQSTNENSSNMNPLAKTTNHMDTDKFITEMRVDGHIETVYTNKNNMSSSNLAQHRDLKILIGHNLKDFVHFNDQQLIEKHLNDVLQKYENTSSVYRFKLNDNKYAFVQTKSKLIKLNVREFIHSLHSIIRDIDTELELKGRSLFLKYSKK
jgi:hypothetical protein